MDNGQAPCPSYHTQTYLPVARQQTTRSESTHQGISPPPTPQLKFIPLPSTPYDRPTLHPLLLYSARPEIRYNLRTSSLRVRHPYPKSRWVYEPATHLPTPFMTLRCAMFPEDISVIPEDYQHVTIKDVLSTVSKAYQRYFPVHGREREKELIPSSLINDTTVPSTSFMWAGISEQIEPGVWLLHLH